MTEERRQAVRMPLTLLVQYRFDTLDDFRVDYAVDVSSRGLFLRTEEQRALGSLVYFQFVLKDGVRLIEGLARIVRHGDDEGHPGVGLEFVNLDDETRAALGALVDEESA